MGDPAGGLELRGDLVVLRDFVPEDRAAFIDWAADEPMYTYMAWRLDGSGAAAAEFERLLRHPERTSPTRRHWYLAVTTTRAGDFCGTAGFDHRPDGLGELGWYLSSPHWGRGYATAATSLLLAFGFDVVGVPAIVATCDPDNAGSRRVLEKSGLRHVGDETIETWRGPRPRLRFEVSAADYVERRA
jgi:ribosomal-protein-alanine N-acetyltransferase